MKRRTQITIVLALAALACLGAESEEPEPLVRVDGHEITSADLEESMRAVDAPRPEALPTGRTPSTSSSRPRSRRPRSRG